MKVRGRKLLMDCKGSALLEFAFAAPILITFMVGVLQLGIVLHANGGIRHAIGEGLRFAKVNRAATNEQIAQAVRDNFSGMESAKVTLLTATRAFDTTRGVASAQIVIEYEVQPVIPFVASNLITLSQTKSIYLPA